MRCPEHHCLCCFLSHLLCHLFCLFNTTVTLIPKIVLLHLTTASRTRSHGEGVKGGERQSSSEWESLSAGCLRPLLCQRCPSKWACHDNLLPIRRPVSATPQALWSTSEGNRQTDHTACLDHYKALSNPVYPIIFFLSGFTPNFLSMGPLPPPKIIFLVNNTGALWKDE